MSNSKQYDLYRLQQILLGKTTYQDLCVFCYDSPEFLPLYRQLTPNTTHEQLIYKLIRYASRKQLLPLLLEQIQIEASLIKPPQPFENINSSVTTENFRGSGNTYTTSGCLNFVANPINIFSNWSIVVKQITLIPSWIKSCLGLVILWVVIGVLSILTYLTYSGLYTHLITDFEWYVAGFLLTLTIISWSSAWMIWQT